MENVISQHITKTPGICGVRACIAGHRIRVMDIVVWHEMRGMSAKDIAAEFPGISLADIHAALTYYLDNRAEIEEDFRHDEQWADWMRANVPAKIPPEARENSVG